MNLEVKRTLWNDSLITGHPEIDRQHRVLFSIIDRVENNKEGEDLGAWVLVVLDLIKYVVQHFGFEDDLMIRHGYPNSDGHRKSHALLTAHVTRLRSGIAGGRVDTGELKLFLDGWIQHHIGHEDRQLATFLVGKN